MSQKTRVRASEVKLGPLTRSFEIRQGSLDVEKRTVDLIFAAGSPVARYDWWSGQRYVETLDMSPKAVRMGRLNNGAPLLNAHSSWSLADVIGVVVEGSAKLEDGQGVATVRFPEGDPDVDRVWNKVRQGIVRNVSVGYEVHRYEKTEPDDRKEPIELRAVDWEPYEISLVPMGADDVAKVRSAKSADVRSIPVISTRAATPAPKEEPRAMSKRADVEIKTRIEPNEDGSCPEGYEMAEDGMCRLVEEKTERAKGAAEEKRRIAGIIRCASRLGLSAGSELVKKLIDEGTELVEAQDAIVEWKASVTASNEGPRQGVRQGARVEYDVMDKIHRGMLGAILHRVNPDANKLPDESREYRSRTLMQLAEIMLEQRGVSVRSLMPMELARRAFEPMNIQVRAGLHTTSDFANLLEDAANKMLRQSYEAAPQTWQPIARRVEIRDFKPVRSVQVGEAPQLKKVLEHGEFTRGTITDGKESFSLATYGRVVGLSRQALINDDLNGFGDLIMSFGQSARNLESDLVWFPIVYGKTQQLADGVAIFASGHGNFTDTGTAISIDSLGVGRALMRKQKALDGVTYLNLRARYLMVPPDLETIAQQFTTAITPAEGGKVNPFAGNLEVIAEPRLGGSITVDGVTASGDAAQWYLAASPDQVPIILYGYLAGNEGPFIEARNGFDVDGVETKCRLDFANKVVDYRGLYRNDGAGN